MPTPPPRRTWGTRFDYLVDPPAETHVIASSTSPDMHSRDTTVSTEYDPNTTPAEKECAATDHHQDRAYPPSASSGAPQSIDISPAQARMPHDASVFVASLPSQVPDPELQVRLSDHLSKYAVIKHIKLIRDNRGAVCAFVQVESSEQANSLIAGCNLSQFMDRHIRCEFARAFRTLLISWRPSIVHASNDAHEGGEQNIDGTGRALRLRRCRNTRYIQVTHSVDAIPSDPDQLPNYSPPRADDALSGPGIFLPQGIKDGDFDCLKSLLEAFGALEFITPFEPATQRPAHVPQSGQENAFSRGGAAASYDDKKEEELHAKPESHVQMWAAKWAHRNDAVSAITALQYVPNLAVFWAHTYGRPLHQNSNAPYTPYRTASGFYAQSSPSYPPTPYTPRYAASNASESENRRFADSDHSKPHAESADDAQWAAVAPRLQQLHAQALRLPIVQGDSKKLQDPVTFSDSDFPPLKGESGMMPGRGKGKRGAWLGRRNFVRAGAPSPPPISTASPTASRLYDQADTPTSAVPHTPDLDSVIEPSPITPAFPMTPRTPSGGHGPPSDLPDKEVTYLSTQGFIPPHTSPQAFASYAPYTSYGAPDPTELFVGGLGVSTWDEERVRSVFGRFGTIEEMRFVKPGYQAPPHRRAFAFIRYTNQEAPLRAIEEEHLRLYDDCKIKVQLRDVNPPRRGGYRGRGRFQHRFTRAERVSLDFERDSNAGDALVGPADGSHKIEDTAAHVRFASAPNVVSVSGENDEAGQKQEGTQALASRSFEDFSESGLVEAEEQGEGAEMQHLDPDAMASSTSSCSSDAVPDASMEVQTHSADTTVTLADVTISLASPRAESPEHALQSEMESLTVVSATPPPSNPDASSTYAPSSTGSAPTSTGYYPSMPSWIPPYAIPQAPYGPYGTYYPQQVPAQSGTDAQTTYPPAWMATLYRNVMPFAPWFHPPPGVELAQPPVRPTGYIQRDAGGIFIPVYPPERLGQYMSTSGTTIDQSQAQAQSSAPSIGNWQNLPPHPQLYMQQAMMMQQQAITAAQQQQQQQLPVTGNSWVTGPPPGSTYPAQHAPSSAPPPYPAPNAYFPSQASPAHTRQGMYGPYDSGTAQQPQTVKNSNMRQQRQPGNFGHREGRPLQRRGPGMHGNVDQSFAAGAVDSQFAYGHVKPVNVLPAQLAVPSSGNGSAEWNWNSQNR